jgi:hypothetical protein
MDLLIHLIEVINFLPCNSREKIAKAFWGNLRAPPYNKQVDRTKLARHAACLRKRRAGTGQSLLLRRRDWPQALPLT